MNGILSQSISCARVTCRCRTCTGMSCGSVAPPSTWMTSKLWHSLMRLQKSSNVPARRPRAVSMMLGGPEVGAKATHRSGAARGARGSTACSVISRGAVASEAPTSPRASRTICVDSSTSRAGAAGTARARRPTAPSCPASRGCRAPLRAWRRPDRPRTPSSARRDCADGGRCACGRRPRGWCRRLPAGAGCASRPSLQAVSCKCRSRLWAGNYYREKAAPARASPRNLQRPRRIDFLSICLYAMPPRICLYPIRARIRVARAAAARSRSSAPPPRPDNRVPGPTCASFSVTLVSTCGSAAPARRARRRVRASRETRSRMLERRLGSG